MIQRILNGKNIVVTGASRGLGAAAARALWWEGANLLLVGRNNNTLEQLKDKLQQSAVKGQKIAHVVADLEMAGSAEIIIDAALNKLQSIDVLLNNAAVVGPIGKTWETDWQQWETTIRINLLSPIQLSRGCVPAMKKRGGGKIINISGGGATGPRPNFSAYAIAKTGLVRFTEILALEVAEWNIQVNAIAPGMMNTEMTKAVLDAGKDKAGAKEYSDAIKLAGEGGRSAEKASELCVFLASSKSDGITGKLLSAVWDPWDTLQHHIEDLKSSDIYTLRRIVPEDRGKHWR